MLDYGEIAYAHSSPFQAEMFPGEILQVMEKKNQSIINVR